MRSHSLDPQNVERESSMRTPCSASSLRQAAPPGVTIFLLRGKIFALTEGGLAGGASE
jgi:hypothetical protein